LKNVHLSRCATSLVIRHTSMYASFSPRPPQGGLLRALHLDVFEPPEGGKQPACPLHRGFIIEFFNKLLVLERTMALKKTLRHVLGLLLIGHLAFAVADRPVRAEEPAKVEAGEAEETASPKRQEPEGVKAVAVYYGKRYQGRRTASGAVFDHRKLTAAHPTIPHGTRVKVVNLANDRSVVVTVNDRCRDHGYELIDLTRTAAARLGFLGRRAARVTIFPLSDE
jgi:rare lipoprotein A